MARSSVSSSNYYRALEAIRNVDTVVFDKTGTLTTGHLAVTAVTPAEGWQSDQILAGGGRRESGSEHAIATAVLAASPDHPRWSTSEPSPAAVSPERWETIG